MLTTIFERFVCEFDDDCNFIKYANNFVGKFIVKISEFFY